MVASSSGDVELSDAIPDGSGGVFVTWTNATTGEAADPHIKFPFIPIHCAWITPRPVRSSYDLNTVMAPPALSLMEIFDSCDCGEEQTATP